MLETTPPTGGGAKQPKTLAAWHPCALALMLLRFRHPPRAPSATPNRVHNLRQAEAAIRLWIKTAKEDVLEIPPPRERLVYA